MLFLSLRQIPPVIHPARSPGGKDGVQFVVLIPGAVGKEVENIFAGIRPNKGVKSIFTAVVVAAVTVDAQRNPALHFLVPNFVGDRDGPGQNPLGQCQEKEDTDHARGNDGGGNFSQGNAARLERNQLIAVVEYAQGDHPGKQHTHRAHLFNNKGDVEDEKLEDQACGFALFKKVVNFLEKIDEQVQGNERGKQHAQIAQKIPKDIASEQHDV